MKSLNRIPSSPARNNGMPTPTAPLNRSRLLLPLSLAAALGISALAANPAAADEPSTPAPQASATEPVPFSQIAPNNLTTTFGATIVNQTNDTSATNNFFSVAVDTTPSGFDFSATDRNQNKLNIADKYIFTGTVARGGASGVPVMGLDLTAAMVGTMEVNTALVDLVEFGATSTLGAQAVLTNPQNPQLQTGLYFNGAVNLGFDKTLIPNNLTVALGVAANAWAMLPAYTIDGTHFQNFQPAITPWARVDGPYGLSFGCYPSLYVTNTHAPAWFGTCNLSMTQPLKKIASIF